VYGEEKKNFTGLTRAAKAGQKSLVLAQQAQRTKKVPLSIVLFESPFTSVSTVSMGHPSLISLGNTVKSSKQFPNPSACYFNIEIKLSAWGLCRSVSNGRTIEYTVLILHLVYSFCLECLPIMYLGF
jgi:hypothetical protein